MAFAMLPLNEWPQDEQLGGGDALSIFSVICVSQSGQTIVVEIKSLRSATVTRYAAVTACDYSKPNKSPDRSRGLMGSVCGLCGLVERWAVRIQLVFPLDTALAEPESVCHLLGVQGFKQVGVNQGLQFPAQGRVDAKGFALVDGNLLKIAQSQNHKPDSAIDLKQSGVGKEFGVTAKIGFSHIRLSCRWIWSGLRPVLLTGRGPFHVREYTKVKRNGLTIKYSGMTQMCGYNRRIKAKPTDSSIVRGSATVQQTAPIAEILVAQIAGCLIRG
jgi:hypothetical protein